MILLFSVLVLYFLTGGLLSIRFGYGFCNPGEKAWGHMGGASKGFEQMDAPVHRNRRGENVFTSD